MSVYGASVFDPEIADEGDGIPVGIVGRAEFDALVDRHNLTVLDATAGNVAEMAGEVVDREVDGGGPGGGKRVAHLRPAVVGDLPLDQGIHRSVVRGASEESFVPVLADRDIGDRHYGENVGDHDATPFRFGGKRIRYPTCRSSRRCPARAMTAVPDHPGTRRTR